MSNTVPFLLVQEVGARFRKSRSATYSAIEHGLLPRPIKIGKRAVWPASEIDTVVRARIAGRSEAEIRTLVKKLVAARATADQVA